MMKNELAIAKHITSFPLTREQQGLWVEWKLSPTGASYNTCVQSILVGDLDVERFRQSIADVVATFELLRGYCVEDGDDVRIELSDLEFDMPLIDVSGGEETESAAAKRQAMALLNRRRDAAIDLTTFPLIRAALIRTARQRYYFIGVVPHLISDGYSAVFILHAISIAYAKGRAGLLDAFGDDRKDWTDYLAWRSEADPAATTRAADHWQSVLANAEHITPICGKELSVTDTHGKRRHFEIPEGVAKRLRKLAFAQRTSLFSALAAIYAAFLHRYTGSQDIVVAFPVDLRPRGYREAFGFFVNVIPVRIDVSGNPSFAELISRVGKARRVDKKHQHLPALDIVKAKRRIDSGFDGRLTNVSMGQTVSRFQGLALDNVVCEPLDNELIEVRDDLSFMYEVTEGPIGIWLEYRESAFTEPEIDQMHRHMLALIEGMDAQPDLPIDDIALMTPAEIDDVLNAGRGASLELPHPSLAAALTESFNRFAEHPALLPDTGGDAVSYQQLHKLSLTLAGLLPETGQRVALLLNDRAWQIACIVSALQAGVAYVPIDPSLPARRIRAIIDSAQPATMFCDDQRLCDELSDAVDAIQFLPAFEAPQTLGVATANKTDATHEIDPSTPAYVIFTSGSTGAPKGVEVSQLAAMHRLAWLGSAFTMRPGNRMLANTSYAFDVSVAEMLWPLTNGAALVLADSTRSRDARYVRQRIDVADVDTLAIVPSALGALLEAPSQASLASLKQVLAAGEALPARLVSRFHALASGELFNVYGPTEAAVYATCDKTEPLQDAVTIGRAIANTDVVVVNTALAVQPFGVVGELCISGPGLARGYVGDEQLTAERFVDNPYGDGKLYRTGDTARLLPDGRVDYLGRTDSQIKLRGYRIDLGDVAAALQEHPAINDVAITVRKHGSTGADQLVAYYAATDDADLESQELTTHCAHALPGYMVPSRFESLARIPRLASGKLDNAQLPADTRSSDSLIRQKPDSPRQKLMAQAWAQTLNLPLDEVGLQSSFFELGGDSLMLISLACALEERGCFVEVHELFDNPTIAEAEPLVRTTSDLAINQDPETGTFLTLPRQTKLLSDGFDNPAHWNRCIEVAFNRHLDVDALQHAYAAVLAHHDGLRLSFDTNAHPPTFTYHLAAAVDSQVQVCDLTEIVEGDREHHAKAVLNRANASFDLSQPPLIKLLLLDDETRSKVVLVCHHLLIDMRSCQVLLEDLMASYTAAISRRTARLPARSSSLGEWSRRLHAEIDQAWRADELPFWQEQLRGAASPIVGDAPVSSPSPTEADMRSTSLRLSVSETSALGRLADASLGTGLHELSLTAFATAFVETTGQSRLVFNTCGVGRDKMFDEISLLRTVGEINTVYPVAIDLGKDDHVGSVREALNRVPERGANYGMLRYIAAHKSLTSQPEPIVFFNYVSRIDTALADTFGATVTIAPPDVATSDPNNRACYELYAEVSIQGGQLNLDLGYNQTSIGETVAQDLMRRWQANLRESGSASAVPKRAEMRTMSLNQA